MDHLEHGGLDRKQSKEKGTQSGIFEEIDEAKIPAKPNNEDCECMDTQDVTNDIKKFNNDEALVKRKSDENHQLQESEKNALSRMTSGKTSKNLCMNYHIQTPSMVVQ